MVWPFGGSKKRRVLIVDDDVNVRTMLAMYFTEAGWEVREAGNGQEGVDAAKATAPDLILLDIDMPVITGRDALMLLRGNEATAKVPVVMVTARGTLDDVEQCLSRGANDYLTKPFDFARLAAKLDKLVPAE